MSAESQSQVQEAGASMGDTRDSGLPLDGRRHSPARGRPGSHRRVEGAGGRVRLLLHARRSGGSSHSSPSTTRKALGAFQVNLPDGWQKRGAIHFMVCVAIAMIPTALPTAVLLLH